MIFQLLGVLPVVFGISGVLCSVALSGQENMPQMPVIKARRLYTVPSVEVGQGLLDQRGFGDQAPMVNMMNLMMVGGSGYEGMEMGEGQKKIEAVAQNSGARSSDLDSQYDFEVKGPPLHVGSNLLKFVIRDKKEKTPAKGLQLKAQVYMNDMNMGTEEPRVVEVSPGEYQLKAIFSMEGSWALKLIFPKQGEKLFNFEAQGQ